MSEDPKEKEAEDSSGSSSDSDSSSDSEDEIGPLPPSAQAGETEGDGDKNDEDEPPPSKKPKKERKKLPFEKEYLADLPNCERYEKSFMHRDVITKVLVAPGGFVVTASVDGHLKFWKKDSEGFEFVKHFRAHIGPILDMALNASGTLLATISSDRHAKVFDVQNFDMINIIKLDETPVKAEWVHRSEDLVPALAVVFEKSIRIYHGKDCEGPLRVLDKLHFKPVVAIKYNSHFDTAISVDEGGMVEYWHGPQGDFGIAYEGTSSKKSVMFDSKLDTDLFDMAKAKTVPLDIDVSPKDGKLWAAICADRKIRIFRFLSGKLYLVIDESLNNYIKLQAEKKMFQAMDFNRKVSNEKDLDKKEEPLTIRTSAGGTASHQLPPPISGTNVVFDKTGHFILYPTMIGIKTVNLYSNTSCGVPIGNSENLRFLNIALSQGSDDLTQPSSGASSMPSSIEQHVSENPGLKKAHADPILFCTAHKKNRFYLFTRSMPRETHGGERDVFNEKPSQEERLAAVTEDASLQGQSKLYESATIHTSMGDIFVKLFPRECPKTVENFCSLAKSKYYNDCIFHRVIKQFMLQTGDPTGVGTGGESSFGHEFEDEFHPKLKHDRPYTLSMANAGPNTNGSQFFLTVVPTPWLDNKHTVFGRVTKGMDVVLAISNVKTQAKTDKPYDDITMVSVSLRDPFRM